MFEVLSRGARRAASSVPQPACFAERLNPDLTAECKFGLEGPLSEQSLGSEAACYTSQANSQEKRFDLIRSPLSFPIQISDWIRRHLHMFRRYPLGIRCSFCQDHGPSKASFSEPCRELSYRYLLSPVTSGGGGEKRLPKNAPSAGSGSSLSKVPPKDASDLTFPGALRI